MAKEIVVHVRIPIKIYRALVLHAKCEQRTLASLLRYIVAQFTKEK